MLAAYVVYDPYWDPVHAFADEAIPEALPPAN